MNELTEILKQTVDRLLNDYVTRESLEAAEGGMFPHKLWKALESSGLTQPLATEQDGGVDAHFTNAYEIIYGAGYHSAPVPLIETILASWLAQKTGISVPKGPITLIENRRSSALKFKQTGSDWSLSGTAAHTPWGSEAEHVFVIADAGGALRSGILQTSKTTIIPDLNMAKEPRDTLIFERTPVCEISEPLSYEITRDVIRLYGAMFRSAQMAGASQRALDLAVEYARERKAFGRPIAKFQAVQHQLANLAAHVAQATIATEAAFRAADQRDPRFEISIAKIVAGQTATLAAETAHQVFAAIGFTHDHMLNFSTRRLWCWRAEYGSDNNWAEEIGRRATGRGPDMLWNDLTEVQS